MEGREGGREAHFCFVLNDADSNHQIFHHRASGP